MRRRVRKLGDIFHNLLRYGKSATVLEPEELRKKVRQELEVWRENYKD